MIENKKVIAIIPARGGSKGLPRKNIKDICGKPLIAWSIDHAKQSKYVDEVFVSTDDTEIAEVSKKYGCPVPFLRPAHLATDTASPVDAVLDVLEKLEKEDKRFDYLVLLQPTSPLREIDDVNKMIELLHKNEKLKDGICSAGEATITPYKMKRIKGLDVLPFIENIKGESRRQDLETVYFPYGLGYVVKVDAFKEEKTFYPKRLMPYMIARHQCYEIDDFYDHIVVETVMKHHI